MHAFNLAAAFARGSRRLVSSSSFLKTSSASSFSSTARVVLTGVAVCAGGIAAVYRLYAKEAEAVGGKPARPIVVAGPSGVGKGTLIQKLLTEYPEQFAFSVSHTTRAPRSGELNGVHYWFVDRDQFEKILSEGGFIESNEYNGNLYGTSHMAVKSVADQGRTCLFDVDINGVISFKTAKFDQQPRFLFLSPPGDQPLAVLEQRLRGRGTESEESLKRRLTQAKYELRFRDIPHFFDRIIINDDLDKAYAEFKAFSTQEE